MRKNTEESLAARIATVGVKSEKALHKEKGAVFNPLAGDPLEIEVPTFGAVSETSEGDRHAMTVKAALASMAAPGLKPRKSKE